MFYSNELHCTAHDLYEAAANVIPLRPDLVGLWLENSFSVDVDVNHVCVRVPYELSPDKALFVHRTTIRSGYSHERRWMQE